jgi:hypothetical protein
MAVRKVSKHNSIRFSLTVEMDNGPEGTERYFDVKDDGWKIWIRKEDGSYFDSVTFGVESVRMPNADTALIQLDRWARERWGSADKALNDPTMSCCGRDAADCDCENPIP